MLKAEDIGKSTRQVFPSDTGESALAELAPHTAWTALKESEHFVQFYEADDFLLDSLTDFVRAGLAAGDACIIVATPAHRAGLGERLHTSGVAVTAAVASGQFVLLDAAETLLQFMVDGSPEPGRFAAVIGDIIVRAAEGQRGVRIFGEMVALLWAEHNHAAALRLEELWNQLLQTHACTLFCAYPMSGFAGEALAEPLGHVCAGHARVIPAESYAALTDTNARLRTIIELQQKARSLESEIAVRKEAERSLRAVKDELESQVETLRRLHAENARLNQQMQRELDERAALLSREQQARAEAEHANRLKDEFLATVSHELRTPLNAIIGWAHMLRHGRLDEAAVTRALETIERNAQSQAQLIEDILDVARAITGQLQLNIGPVDVAAVINAAVDAVQLAADAKAIRLEVTLEPAARHIQGDAGRLQQVVWNLLANAIKFTPAGGRVEVGLERVGASVQIRVTDTGEGINPAFLPYIFDRFRQEDATSTRRHGGLGLGLAIVRHLVEQHGGTVHADSQGQGRGATFTIKLPLASADERAHGRGKVTAELRPADPPAVEMKRR